MKKPIFNYIILGNENDPDAICEVIVKAQIETEMCKQSELAYKYYFTKIANKANNLLPVFHNGRIVTYTTNLSDDEFVENLNDDYEDEDD